MTIFQFSIAAFFVLIFVGAFLLLKDYRRYVFQRVVSFRFPKNQFVDLGEYTVTTFVVLFIAVSGVLFYKSSTAIVAYMLSDDLTSFYVILRSVFTTRSGYENQNPFILDHFLHGFFIVPALQFLACLLMFKALRKFGTLINRKYRNPVHTDSVYTDRDILFFGFGTTLVFIIGEFFSYSQSLSGFTGLAHFIYLTVSNISPLCFFLAVSHNHHLKDPRYVSSIPTYFSLSEWQRSIIFTPVNVIVFAYMVGILLQVPLRLGTQFLSNVIVVLNLLICSALFYFVLKYFIKGGFDHFGAVLMEESSDEQLEEDPHEKSVSIQIDRKALKRIGIPLLVVILINLKLSIFVLTFVLIVTVIVSFLYTLFYGAGFGFSLLWTKFCGYQCPLVKEALNRDYFISAGFYAVLSVRFLLVPTLILFLLISFFPIRFNSGNTENHLVSVFEDQGLPLFIDRSGGNGSIPISNGSIPVDYEKIPDFLLKVLFLQEDRDFTNQHSWFPKWSNWNGISIASLYRFMTGTGGGSNLNMQLIKNEAFPNRGFPQDIQRKFVEVLASYQLSRQLAPEEIVTRYLDIVGMSGGQGHSGFMAASLEVFNLPIWQINELEMFYLVSTLTSGSGVNMDDGFIPYNEIENHRDEIKKALLAKAQLWYERELLTTREFRMLRNQDLRIVNERIPVETRASTRDFFKKEVEMEDNQNSKTFISTLSTDNQQKISHAVQAFESRFRDDLRVDEFNLYSSTLVVEVGTGNIVAHHGGSGVSDLTQFMDGNPMASLMKPFLFLELLEIGFSSDMELYDGPVPGRQTPRNDGRPYLYRNVGMNEVLSRSLNAPVVNIRELTDPIELFQSVERRFQAMGVRTDPYLDLSDPLKYPEYEVNYPLGSRNMTLYDVAQLYQVLLNDGHYVELSMFKERYNPNEFSTEAIPKTEETIYSRQHASEVKSALRGTLLPGGTVDHLSRLLPNYRTFYAKTGTSDQGLHGYTMLSDGNILIISWMSYGKVEDGHLELNNTPPIPLQSGSWSAGVLAALVYNQFVRKF